MGIGVYMFRSFVLLGVLLLMACTPLNATSTTDVATLQQLERAAEQRVREKIQNPLLRQLNTDLVQYTFFYADAERTTVYTVNIPSAETPSSEWELVQNNDPRLMNSPSPSMDLATLVVSPQQIGDALQQEWAGCLLKGLTLYFNLQSEDLMWTGFCEVKGGLVSGSISNSNGLFIPVNAGPALPPPTASPN